MWAEDDFLIDLRRYRLISSTFRLHLCGSSHMLRKCHKLTRFYSCCIAFEFIWTTGTILQRCLSLSCGGHDNALFSQNVKWRVILFHQTIDKAQELLPKPKNHQNTSTLIEARSLHLLQPRRRVRESFSFQNLMGIYGSVYKIKERPEH